MNDLEKEKLTKFADDPVLFLALQKSVLGAIPEFAWTNDMSNEQIGATLRAHDLAEQFIKTGLDVIRRQYQSTKKPVGDNSNPAV